MRYTPLALAVLLTLGVPLSSAAQETPRAEVFGGYSWTRVDGRDMNGWNASVTLNLREWLGISTDISGLETSLGNTERSRTGYWLVRGYRWGGAVSRPSPTRWPALSTRAPSSSS